MTDDRKRQGIVSLHVKLPRAVHNVFKAKLALREMSMQECFEEFARLVATDNSNVHRTLDGFARRKLQLELERKGNRAPSKYSKETCVNSELDSEALYSLIGEASDGSKDDDDENDDDEDRGGRGQAA